MTARKPCSTCGSVLFGEAAAAPPEPQHHDVDACWCGQDHSPETGAPPEPPRPDLQQQVADDLLRRREAGVREYGVPLQPHNGRDALVDAYEEALDLACYLKQAIVERSAAPLEPPPLDVLAEVQEAWDGFVNESVAGRRDRLWVIQQMNGFLDNFEAHVRARLSEGSGATEGEEHEDESS